MLLAAAVAFLLIGATEFAFEKLGFTRLQVVGILVGTFVGSSVNIPLWRVRRVEPLLQVEEVRFFWVTYRVPRISVEELSTVIAINLGGGIIPTIVSLYLVATRMQLLLHALLGIFITSVLVHLVARKVAGIGIAAPTFVPPLAAALIAYSLAPSAANIIAYICGTLGTLIGADLTNLNGVEKLGAPVVSIGGAGTFDGIFLSGLLAVLLV